MDTENWTIFALLPADATDVQFTFADEESVDPDAVIELEDYLVVGAQTTVTDAGEDVFAGSFGWINPDGSAGQSTALSWADDR